jgi:hypothetical protein
MNKAIYPVLLLILSLLGCEQPVEESPRAAVASVTPQPTATRQDSSKASLGNQVFAEQSSKNKLGSVNEDHLNEAQHTLTSRLEVLIQDAVDLQGQGVYITEYASGDRPMIPPEERFLAFQAGFRAGVIRGINKPIVSAYFPETLPSKIQQQHWQKGQEAGHAYGVYMLKDYLAEKYDYTFESN